MTPLPSHMIQARGKAMMVFGVLSREVRPTLKR